MVSAVIGSHKLKFVAINGSYRAAGNGHSVLTHAREELAQHDIELTIIDLADHTITGCGPCGDCNARTTLCEVADDVPSIIEEMAEADGIILCAPVQGFGMGSLMQSFIERAGVGHLRFDRKLTNKVACAVVIGRRYSHTEVYGQLVDNILLNRMIIVGSGFPPIFYGNHPGEALHDTEALEMFDRTLSRMANLARVLSEHRTLTGTDLLHTEHVTEREDKWFAARRAG